MTAVIASPSGDVYSPPSRANVRYYATPELQQRLFLIQYLIENSEQLLLILAEAGCGKTSLLQQVEAKAGETWWLYTLRSTPALAPDIFTLTLLRAFNVTTDGKPIAVQQERLRNRIKAARQSGRLPVLLVDDAHLLPLATLKTVVELAMFEEARERVRVVLFCEPQITSILASPEFAIVQNTLIHTLDVPPFSDTQLRDYIQFFLQDAAQAHRVHPFTQEKIKKIFQQSDGVPAQVNLLIQQSLSVEEKQKVVVENSSISIPQKHFLWLIIIAFLAAGIVGMLYQLFSQKNVQKNLISPHSISTDAPLDKANMRMTSAIFSAPAENVVVFVPAKPQASVPITGNNTNIVSSLPAVTRATPALVSPPPTVEEKKPAVLQTTPLRENFDPSSLLGEGIRARGEEWLWAQNPYAYTLQILGTHDFSALKKVIVENNLQDIAIYKTEHRGKAWYVLVQGVFNHRALAEIALKDLPPALRKTNNPWIKTIASVQARIDAPLQ